MRTAAPRAEGVWPWTREKKSKCCETPKLARLQGQNANNPPSQGETAMTTRTLNLNDLELIAGGAVEIAEEGSAPASSKTKAPMGETADYSSNSGLDTEVFGENGGL